MRKPPNKSKTDEIERVAKKVIEDEKRPNKKSGIFQAIEELDADERAAKRKGGGVSRARLRK